MHFDKYHGLGNDIIIVDGDDPEWTKLSSNDPARLSSAVRALSRRRTGVGCDQVMAVERPPENVKVDAKIRIFNADGGEAEACGNGTRCVVDYLSSKLCKAEISLLSPTGTVLRGARIGKADVRVEQGRPRMMLDAPLDLAEFGLEGEVGVAVDVGNPHLVIFLKHKSHLEHFERLGAALERHPSFPNRTNVAFCVEATVNGAATPAVKVFMWERGAGRTRACGSGACAVAFSYLVDKEKEDALIIEMEGGTLEMELDRQTGLVSHRGPAVKVFEGNVNVDDLLSDDGIDL